MQSPEIVFSALATIAVGAAALRYQSTGRRRFELLLIAFGVVTVGSGLAMFRDGVSGSRAFLWMLPSVEATAAEAVSPAGGIVAHARSDVRAAEVD